MDKISLLVVEDDKKASSELERIFKRHTDFNLFLLMLLQRRLR